ncbi:MAG: hypothetical protein MI924_30010, partial [Chloroflexales bacterium]|nr:hypothetical protein [Chloroflexales bacterium]
MNEKLRADAEAIANFLERYRSATGVADPDEAMVLPYSYTTEFYAWLCALLYTAGRGDIWFERAASATKAALDTLDAHTCQRLTTLPGGNFHWEFKNMALLHVEQCIGSRFDPALHRRLQQALLDWQDLNIDSANWTAMRALSYLLRGLHFKRPSDHWRSRLELTLVLGMQTPEGLLPDTPQSRSLQYHAYTLSLLGLHYQLSAHDHVRDALLSGARFIADFIDPEGDFNYFGRGQRQIFGYASLILALRAAAHCTPDHAEAARFATLAERVLGFMHRFCDADGIFPLVLNTAGEQWGWYCYNRRGDYLAFCGVWFLLAAAYPEITPAASVDATCYLHGYPGVGLAAARGNGWFAVLSSRGDDLAEPLGLVHISPAGPTCLGGPDPERARDIDYSENYFGPLVAGQAVLQHSNGTMEVANGSVRLRFMLPELEVEQIYRVDGGLTLEQTLTPRGRLHTVTPLVSAGYRPQSALTLQETPGVASPLGTISRYDGENITIDKPYTLRVELTHRDEAQACMTYTKPISANGLSIGRTLVKAIWLAWIWLTVTHQT